MDYFCDDGFTLEGNAEVTCQSNGEWSGSPPTCLPVVCPIEEVEHGYYRYLSAQLFVVLQTQDVKIYINKHITLKVGWSKIWKR